MNGFPDRHASDDEDELVEVHLFGIAHLTFPARRRSAQVADFGQIGVKVKHRVKRHFACRQRRIEPREHGVGVEQRLRLTQRRDDDGVDVIDEGRRVEDQVTRPLLEGADV